MSPLSQSVWRALSLMFELFVYCVLHSHTHTHAFKGLLNLQKVLYVCVTHDVFAMFLLSGMCNPKNLSDTPATAKSTVEELQRPIPSLFRALTDGDAPINMLVVSFPAAEELSYQQNLLSFLETLEDAHHNVSLPGNSIHASYDTKNLKYYYDLKLNCFLCEYVLNCNVFL
uniref:Uncharacterized protein n=1 Tax=Sinocyclocheilus rhinocerous TaxID=307959 RepID=A0A673LS19_9TELE